VHNGAEDKGELPVTAWQFEQSFVNVGCVDCVWATARNGTAWFGAPGPPEWHPTEACSAFE
jgi:hypothetical protein